jgi:hypothetical protein
MCVYIVLYVKHCYIIVPLPVNILVYPHYGYGNAHKHVNKVKQYGRTSYIVVRT